MICIAILRKYYITFVAYAEIYCIARSFNIFEQSRIPVRGLFALNLIFSIFNWSFIANKVFFWILGREVLGETIPKKVIIFYTILMMFLEQQKYLHTESRKCDTWIFYIGENERIQLTGDTKRNKKINNVLLVQNLMCLCRHPTYPHAFEHHYTGNILDAIEYASTIEIYVKHYTVCLNWNINKSKRVACSHQTFLKKFHFQSKNL